MEGEGGEDRGGEGGLAAQPFPDYIEPMPTIQKTRVSDGESISRNRFGVAPRTLGGLYEAPTSFTSFGTNVAANAPFPAGTFRTLGSINLPAYALSQGTVLRLSFAGSLAWNGVGGGVGFSFIQFRITPDAGGLPYTLQLGSGATAPGAPQGDVFGGQITIFAPNPASISVGLVGNILFSDIQNSAAPVAPVYSRLQTLTLDTAGLASGIDFDIRASLAGAPSIDLIQLDYYLAELVGG